MPEPDLLILRPEGLYCPPGDFFIDPMRPVARAVITHAHADHARRGHGAYLAAATGVPVLRARLGDIKLQPLDYGEAVSVGGVRVSLHPAGHVLGSAQVRLEHAGRVWVASGDYFLSGHAGDANPTCAPFEPQRCDVFITESTFGLPVYRWRPQAEVLADINAWWHANADAGRTSVLRAYSLGKAQRLLAGVDATIGPLVVHAGVHAMNQAYRAAGVALPQTVRLDGADSATLQRALVVVPPGAGSDDLAQAQGACREAFASGWMQVRSTRRRQGLDRGFALSDHADWPGLQRAIAATGAQRVIVTHGQEAVMVRWLRQQGLWADSFGNGFGGIDDASAAARSAPVTAPIAHGSC